MIKYFEAGGYAIDNKGKVYNVVNLLTICEVEYVKLLRELKNGKKIHFYREIHFNPLRSEEFCYYQRRSRKGYIKPFKPFPESEKINKENKI